MNELQLCRKRERKANLRLKPTDRMERRTRLGGGLFGISTADARQKTPWWAQAQQ